MNTVKKGDVIIMKENCVEHELRNKIGIVVSAGNDYTSYIGVDFLKEFEVTHSLDGDLTGHTGRYVEKYYVTII